MKRNADTAKFQHRLTAANKRRRVTHDLPDAKEFHNLGYAAEAVLKYLSISDLSNVTQVSPSWKAVVLEHGRTIVRQKTKAKIAKVAVILKAGEACTIQGSHSAQVNCYELRHQVLQALQHKWMYEKIFGEMPEVPARVRDAIVAFDPFFRTSWFDICAPIRCFKIPFCHNVKHIVRKVFEESAMEQDLPVDAIFSFSGYRDYLFQCLDIHIQSSMPCQ